MSKTYWAVKVTSESGETDWLKYLGYGPAIFVNEERAKERASKVCHEEAVKVKIVEVSSED
jgi:hypothetical protein